MCRAFTNGKKEGKRVDDFRKEVIKELEKKLGNGYCIFPKDKLKNNNFTVHGICIRKRDEVIGTVVYVDEYILLYAVGLMKLEKIADELIQQCHKGEIPSKIADDLEDFGRMRDKVRIRLINYDANPTELKNVPHRKFLDLAVTYYLDIDVTISEGNASIIVSNELMERWNVAEGDLYRAGMENLQVKDECFAIDIPGLLKEIVQEEDEEEVMAVLDEIEKEGVPKVEMYVASNRKHLFGAACMLDLSFLKQLADSKGCDLNIYPSCVNELIVIPIKDGNEDCINTEDVWEINMSNVPKEEWLSNSIYLYDRAKQEVSIYKEGAPL